MITIKTESAAPNGMVRRRYTITVTDQQGNEVTEVLGVFTHHKDNDGSEVESSFIADNKRQELDMYIECITSGHNPFYEHELKWNSRNEMLKHILDLALSKPASDPYVIQGLPYMQFVTDEELMFLYSKDQEWVTRIRSEIDTLMTSKSIVDSYVPVLEV